MRDCRAVLCTMSAVSAIFMFPSLLYLDLIFFSFVIVDTWHTFTIQLISIYTHNENTKKNVCVCVRVWYIRFLSYCLIHRSCLIES